MSHYIKCVSVFAYKPELYIDIHKNHKESYEGEYGIPELNYPDWFVESNEDWCKHWLPYFDEDFVELISRGFDAVTVIHARKWDLLKDIEISADLVADTYLIVTVCEDRQYNVFCKNVAALPDSCRIALDAELSNHNMETNWEEAYAAQGHHEMKLIHKEEKNEFGYR